VLLFWRFSENKALAQKLLKTAERDLFYAKEKRIAQVGWALRPVFWMVRVAMPRQARRLSKACERCIRLAQQQESRQAGRDAVRQAYLEWRRDYVDKPLAELHRKADEVERQAQKKQASGIAPWGARGRNRPWGALAAGTAALGWELVWKVLGFIEVCVWSWGT
jgi:hypothetical protein